VGGVFNGLESLGFKELNEIDICKKDHKETTAQQEKEENPTQYLMRKSFICPVCGLEFTDYLVRPSKLRVLDTDTDLRTIYRTIDPNYYDVVLCIHCGYAALHHRFNHLSERQADAVMEKILPSFKSKIYPMPLSSEHAVERHKLALLCSVAKGANSGEKAFLCLKTAWLYRDLEDTDNELLFLKNAYTLFKDAYTNESSPFGPFDENTTHMLIAELARRTGDFDEAKMWISRLMNKKGITTVIKKRSEVIRDLIRGKNAEEDPLDEYPDSD